jgi:hypothetical protein
MNVFTKLRHALLGRPQPKITRLDGAETTALRIDELPPFNLHIAELMRYDPQVRIGLGARNGLLMSAEVDVAGDDSRVVRWVQHQWNALWHGAAHQLLRAKLYGFLPFEVVYRAATGGEFRGLVEVDRLVDHHPSEARLLVQGDKIVGFTVEPSSFNPKPEARAERRPSVAHLRLRLRVKRAFALPTAGPARRQRSLLTRQNP